ncbi:MAG: cell division protein FtsQ/DivIB [Planctomycetota bacterium]
MARKKTTTKSKKISFRFGGGKKRRRRRAGSLGRTWMVISVTTLVVLTSACVFAAVGVGFVFLEKYVSQKSPLSQQIGALELLGVPAWLNEPLKEKIFAAALGNSGVLRVDADAARLVQENLVREVPWLDNVTVQVTHDRIRVRASWRKPVALIRLGVRKLYVDGELVVLDHVPLPQLAIVEVRGLSVPTKVPKPGKVWQQNDLAAAVTILDRLDQMDKLVAADKPLLKEIKSIDVTNYDGLKNSRAPHIVLYTKDNTEIKWGAEYGKWQRHLECTDKLKLAKLSRQALSAL